MTVALKISNLSKMYRLGTVGTGTLSHDLNRWWAMLRGKEDPTLKIGQINDRTKTSAGSSSSTENTQSSGPDYVWALRDINLDVEQGEILGIIGRNGAGKSTLLKLLSRVTAPTTGSIKARGRIASLLEVGTGFHPELTGRENVYLNGAIMGMTREEVEKRLEDSESQREVQQWHLRTEIETVRHQLKQQIEKNFGLQQKLKDKDVDLTELLTQAAEL